MRDVLEQLVKRWEAGEPMGLGTVVATFRSAPRPPGAAMLVTEQGEAVGSVSGGCVEGAVYEQATGVIAGGPQVLQRYGVSDDDAFAVGLTCGGILDVFVERVDRESFPELDQVAAAVRAEEPVAVVTVVEHSEPEWVGRRLVVWEDRFSGGVGSARVDAAVVDDARGMLASGRTGTLEYGPEGQRRGEGMRVFVN